MMMETISHSNSQSPQFQFHELVQFRGKIEKIFATYGFVVTSDAQRYFFHFGTCVTKPEFLKVGDEVEFSLGEDSKTHRLHAQRLTKQHADAAHWRRDKPQVTGSTDFTAIRARPSSTTCAASYFLAQSAEKPYESVMRDATMSAVSSNVPLMVNTFSGSGLSDVTSDLARGLSQLQKQAYVSVQCCGLILVPLNQSNDESVGIMACVIAGNPAFVRFTTSDVKYPLERHLLKFGAKVSFTAIYHSSATSWNASEILPDAPLGHGFVRFLSSQVLCIECSSTGRCLNTALANVSLSHQACLSMAKPEVGSFVEFACFANEQGHDVVTRLGVVATPPPPPSSLVVKCPESCAVEESMEATSSSNSLFGVPKYPHQDVVGPTNFSMAFPAKQNQLEVEAMFPHVLQRQHSGDSLRQSTASSFSPTSSAGTNSCSSITDHVMNKPEVSCHFSATANMLAQLRQQDEHSQQQFAQLRAPPHHFLTYEKARQAWFSVA